jgi:hypothetical protein
MSTMLAVCPGVAIYIDLVTVMVHGEDTTTHDKHIRQMFTTMNQHNLTLIDKKGHSLIGPSYVIGISPLQCQCHPESPLIGISTISPLLGQLLETETLQLDCHMSTDKMSS